ncbi:MAG TPA: M20/M25/M40 family metallo-hydrolase [Burkholderiales bacterium]|nr:M20/M25/M40 family metallo-hydrolase [Burkholderiales bacterium]
MNLQLQLGAFALAAFVVSTTASSAELTIPDSARKTFAAITAHGQVKKALDFIRQDDAKTLAEQKEIVVIPAPPFKEEVRAKDYHRRFVALGFKNARIDQEGNVIAVRPGNGKGPKLVVSAHLDTVFPEGTDLAIKEKDGKLYAPGIGDDTRGLAELLSIVRALNATGIKTVGDIWFVGTVGEEGLGDLRGVKALFRDNTDIDGFISIDGPRSERVVFLAVGSHRYRVTFKGPGGHSFGAFGRPSAIHALGRAIAKIGDIQVPKQPKTTFTVGTIGGGTSVNAIAGHAAMELDMRSVENATLLKVEANAMKAINDAVAEENARWGSKAITVEVKLVGDRPAGVQSPDSPIVHAAILGVEAIGMKPVIEDASSTDSNLPISLGIPAVTIGRGGRNENNHSFTESFDPKDAYMGVQKSLLTVLGLVGIEGVAEPMLVKRGKQ